MMKYVVCGVELTRRSLPAVASLSAGFEAAQVLCMAFQHCYFPPFSTLLNITLFSSFTTALLAACCRCKPCILLVANSQMKTPHYHKSAALLISQPDRERKTRIRGGCAEILGVG